MSKKILLGHGVFKINGTPVGLTRGGGQFIVEREIRNIEADGDMGPVKERITIDKSVPKLTVNALEVISDNLPKMYAGMSESSSEGSGDLSGTTKKITGKSKIEAEDYQTNVTWTGKTKGGKGVLITIKNAINLENFDWTLADKDEVVAALTYTGCYDEGSNVEPWDVEYEVEE